VESVPGKGSYITSISPPSSPEEIAMEPRTPENFRGDGERILVVEDQADVLSVTRRALEMNGYIIFTATNSGEALEVFKREQGDFDLVMTDIMLPDRSGFALAKALLSVKPGIKVLFSSGYSTTMRRYPRCRPDAIIT
jgi:CheY-like chemotaxis protein